MILAVVVVEAKVSGVPVVGILDAKVTVNPIAPGGRFGCYCREGQQQGDPLPVVSYHLLLLTYLYALLKLYWAILGGQPRANLQ
jgi:hypothetical protein